MGSFRLSGREHLVFSGVSLVGASDSQSHQIQSEFSEKTAVKFGVLSDRLIDAYIQTGEPLFVLLGFHS